MIDGRYTDDEWQTIVVDAVGGDPWQFAKCSSSQRNDIYLAIYRTADVRPDPFPDQWIDARKEAETFARVVNQLGPPGPGTWDFEGQLDPYGHGVLLATISIKLGA